MKSSAQKKSFSHKANIPANHIEYAMIPEPNPRIYQWQKYWGRKPHNVIREFIEAYCPSDGIVLDPFVGSGVTAIEALKLGRRVIACDLNPMSRDIILATINPPAEEAFQQLADRVRDDLQERVLSLYAHACKYCKNDVTLNAAAIIVGNNGSVSPTEFRYECSCKEESIHEKSRDKSYFAKFSRKLRSSGLWFPNIDLSYSNGEPLSKREHYENYSDLFTPRNLLALATIWGCITSDKWSRTESNTLKILFRSIVHLCSRVSGDRYERPNSAGWTQQSYWYARTPVEINVWSAFDRKLSEYSKVIEEWNEDISDKRNSPIRIARTLNEVFLGNADIFITTQDASTLLRSIEHSQHRVDYIFTDPPYNGMIQYGELSLMWNAWRDDYDSQTYLSDIENSELTENKRQHKQLSDYYQRLSSSFRQMASCIKPGSYIHVTYSSPKVKYRNLTLRSARMAGLEFQKLHFQQSCRPSKKALDQPFGSVFGDFIFRFHRPSEEKATNKRPRNESFSDIVTERTIYMLKHRGEPTPLNIISAECERELFMAGFFDDDASVNNDIKSSIESCNRFKYQGNPKRQIITFRDEREFSGTPLSQRVEKTVRELLSAQQVVNYTDVWSALLREYPNSLTPDTSSLTDALNRFAKKTDGGLWSIKAGANRNKSSVHNTVIAQIAAAAKRLKMHYSIGKPESSDPLFKDIKKHCTDTSTLLKNKSAAAKHKQKQMQNVDICVWDDKHIFCFEVETSTNIMDSIDRFQPFMDHLNEKNPQLILLIANRGKEIARKISSKMTFKRTPEEIKERVHIVSFECNEIESFSKWSYIEKKISSSDSWLDLEEKIIS